MSKAIEAMKEEGWAHVHTKIEADPKGAFQTVAIYQQPCPYEYIVFTREKQKPNAFVDFVDLKRLEAMADLMDLGGGLYGRTIREVLAKIRRA